MGFPGKYEGPTAADNDAPSEFGVEVGHAKRLARKQISPEVGGPYRAMAPGKARFADRHSGYPGERLRG